MLFKKIKEKGKEKEIDITKLNNVIALSDKILRVFYVLLTVVGIYLLIKLCKELHIDKFIFTILGTITPLFIGVFIAWLFEPFVTFLQRKGMRRGLGTFIIYFLFIVILGVVIGAIIPILSEQMNDFAKFIPTLFDSIKDWINNIFETLNKIDGINATAIKSELFVKIESLGTDITAALPTTLFDGVKGIFSVTSDIVIGMIIGFYLLLTFNDASDSLITLLPKKMQNSTRDLINEINTSLRKFIQGAGIDCALVFVVTSIAFGIIGLKSPLIFGLFCGITNVIPYAGPYIGGIPAVIVGFSQGPLVGALTLVSIVVVQFLEGNLLQPIIMSKTTKLHPVTIMIGLLIFGHYFGILGMVIATPVIASFKAIFLYFNDKYEFINLDD